MAKTAAAGAKSAIQAAAITGPGGQGVGWWDVSFPAPRSPSKRCQLVDVELGAQPRDGDDEPEADHGLGCCDHHDGEREDLAVSVAELARVRDQDEVAGVEHDLEREQNDERVAPDQNAERAGREEEDGDDEVRGYAGAAHCTRLSARSSGAALPRITPPTAATRSTIEVTSKASR